MSTNSGEAEQIIEILVYISAQMQILSSSSSTKKRLHCGDAYLQFLCRNSAAAQHSEKIIIASIFPRLYIFEGKGTRVQKPSLLFVLRRWVVHPYLLQMRPQE